MNTKRQWKGLKDVMNTVKVKRWKLSDSGLEFIKISCDKKIYLRNELPMAIKYLEYWIDQKAMTLCDLKKSDIEQFEQGLSDSGLGLSSRNIIRVSLQRYFIWLQEKSLIQANPKDLFPRMGTSPTRRKVNLPNEAIQFLMVMEIQLKKGSLSVYKSAIRSFYYYLQEKNLKIIEVKKVDVNIYLTALGKENISNSTRRHMLILLKCYFRWLHESEIISLEADQLIQYNDIPKREERLPRPLSPEIDKKVQERLGLSISIMHQGLLVMRKTGIRIGELTALKYDCLKTDINGHSFLKVELGKLYTERLVPLHDDTVILIKKIQEETIKYCSNPEKLIHLEDGRKPFVRDYMLAFNDITFGFNTTKPLVSHQFRHTFACEMLNCGMSLIVLKEILGHKDIKMTLQYASVTQGTIRDEFIKAYAIISKQYELPALQSSTKFSPVRALEEIISYLKKVSSININEQKELNLISRRLYRIRNELSDTQR